MPDILIRGVDAQTLKRLKTLARRNGRSLQGEVRRTIEKAAGTGADDVAAMLDAWKRRFAGRRFSSSVALLRKDRQR
jgi:hypothetical protein